MFRLIVTQWERETIGERTATAMAHKKTKRERVGAVPYGYRLATDGHTLVPAAAEQAVIAEARRLKASGLALRTIAAELERAGMVARNGKAFVAAQVQRMVAA
jgi:site-specific DNA recombinase